jgi:hypothetical protein
LHVLENTTEGLYLHQARVLNYEPTERRWAYSEYLLGLALLPQFIYRPDLRTIAAQQLRVATRWVSLSGLAQVHNRSDAVNWAIAVQQSQAMLQTQGGRACSGFWKQGQIQPQEWRRELMLSVLPLLPYFLIEKCSAWMRQHTGQGHRPPELFNRKSPT